MSAFRPSEPDPTAPPRPPPEETHWGPAERRESLWWLASAPAVWAAHLLLTYVTVALWCEKLASAAGELGPAAWAVHAYTAAALVAVAWIGWVGLGRRNLGVAQAPHDFDSPGDRHRFLGLATMLLAGISAVAIAYVEVAVALVATCR